MAEPTTVIAFDEGEVPPEGAYRFELDLSGESGCDVIEDLLFLVNSLKSPFEIRANRKTVSADQLDRSYTKLTVWTNDKDNADFLLLMNELGATVRRV